MILDAAQSLILCKSVRWVILDTVKLFIKKWKRVGLPLLLLYVDFYKNIYFFLDKNYDEATMFQQRQIEKQVNMNFLIRT